MERTIRIAIPSYFSWCSTFYSRASRLLYYYRVPILYFTLARIGLWAIGSLTETYEIGVSSWLRWDARHYLNISFHGYTLHEPGIGGDYATGNLIAFFPLYPLLLKGVTTVSGLGPLTSALVLSSIFMFLGGLVFHEYLKVAHGEKAARIALFLFYFSPAGVFLAAPYSEGLCFLLIAMTFLAMKKDWLAPMAISASVAVVTRWTGILLLPVLAVHFWRRNQKTRLWLLPFILLPLICFIVFQYQEFQTPFAFLKAQQLGWRKTGALPWVGLTNLIQRTSLDPTTIPDLVALALYSLSIVLMVTSENLEETILGSLVILQALSSNQTMSLIRFLLMAIPFYSGWGVFLKRNPSLQIGVLGIVAACWSIGAIAFLTGQVFY